MTDEVTVKKLDPKEFQPKVKGESDFFSWQLFKWLNKHPHYTRIYKTNWCTLLGAKVDYPVLYIGLRQDGCMSGAHLRHICHVGAPLQAWAHCHGEMDVDSWEDVTDEFYDNYRSIGVCAIHGDNWHDWVTDGEKRSCSRCKVSETKVVKMVPKESWIRDSGSVDN